MDNFNELLIKIRKYNPYTDETMIRLAYDFTKKAHKGQKRLSGEDYIVHPLATAHTLADMRLSDTIIIAALLHDVPEDTKYTIKDIQNNFGIEIANLVAGITKLGIIKYRGIERYLENLRKMFIAMAKDIRVVLIKCSDRIHNLETLDPLPKEKQIRIAKESLEIFAQIARRLGIIHFQDMIESRAFRYAYPKEYKWVTSLVTEEYKEEKQRQLAKIMKQLNIVLRKNNVEVIQIYGRAKQLYSLYQKLLKKNRDINKVYDFIATRIIVNSVADCYHILGLIHQNWQPIAGRIKDYIAQPKPNGYQSLHTTIFDEEHNIIEIQIRTFEMHETAEYGIAAHWLYKSDHKSFDETDTTWLKSLTKWHKNFSRNQKHLETLKLDVFQSKIFVFTPKGDVIELPEDSTPVDFAYHIHTEIGDSCLKALVNTLPASLDTKLKNGDMIEIIRSKHRNRPKAEWIKFVKTNTAKNRIKSKIRKKYKNIIE